MVGVEDITTVIRSGRLRWYGHVMRKSDEDCVKKCIEFRECRSGYGQNFRSTKKMSMAERNGEEML